MISRLEQLERRTLLSGVATRVLVVDGGADIHQPDALGSVNGVTTVTDFNAGEGDRVHVYGGVEHHAEQVGADVHVSIGGSGELVLQNTQLNSLQSGWIFS